MSYISNIHQPALINELDTVVINFDEREVKRTDPVTEEEQTLYEYESIRIGKDSYNYGGIVSAIVRYKYTEDDVEAIVLNGTDTADHAAQYAALQSWRSHAKEIAHSIVG